MKGKSTAKARLQGSSMAGGWSLRQDKKSKVKKKGKDSTDQD